MTPMNAISERTRVIGLGFLSNGVFDATEFACHGLHVALCMTDPPLGSFASIAAAATFRERGNPRLKELIRRQAEEIGDLVEVIDAHLAVAVEDFVNPRFAVSQAEREGRCVLISQPEERLDILADNVIRAHNHRK